MLDWLVALLVYVSVCLCVSVASVNGSRVLCQREENTSYSYELQGQGKHNTMKSLRPVRMSARGCIKEEAQCTDRSVDLYFPSSKRN